MENGRGITLLVVEDCDADRELYRRLLGKCKNRTFQFYETCVKEEALLLYDEHKPDCVLIDYKLPGFTGIELLDALRAQSKDSSVAAVILTAGGTELLAARAMRAGAGDYLPKDAVSKESLRIAIENAIEFARCESQSRDRDSSLQAALANAQRACSAKSGFLASMSHEIRTPLNGIVASLELLAERSDLGADREYLELARTSADHLLGVVSEVLDFSKIESGLLLLENNPFSLADAICESVSICRLQAEAKNLSIAIHLADELLQLKVLGDVYRFRQIIINLLGNAVKFTQEHGSISISVEVHEVLDDKIRLHLSLTDTGIGIPQEKQQVIFESYTQADAHIAQRFGGTGLGLNIASKLVAMMGGEIWVESEENCGSTFHFTSCFQIQEETAVPLVRSERKGVDIAMTPLHVLVAEDNHVNQRVIQAILE
ncbi:MAG: response regulator, partial [Bdellovibrionales bacterium]|nr:response regulator [Bdellovibrionales bacterium]